MVATVEIINFTGPLESQVNVSGTTLRFKRADNSVQDTINPLIITPTGTTYSFRKSFKLQAQTPPPNQIENVRWFIDETSGGGSTFTEYGFNLSAGVTTSYTQGNSGDVSALLPGLVDAEVNYTSSSPLTIVSGFWVDNTANFTFGTQDYLVLQMSVSPSATVSLSPTKSLVYRYDES